MNILVSFSGGRTSAFMVKYLKTHPKYKDQNILIVFANTGKENEETLKFVNECDKRWNLGVVWIEAVPNATHGKGTEYKIVDYETANRDGSIFEQIISIYGIPSKKYRHCTRELKEIPIHKYANHIFNKEEYITAVGIRADEKHRIGKQWYPLVELGVDEMFIRKWWSQQEFDLQLKDYEGNCDLCFLKSVRKKLTLLKEKPYLSDWWQKQEETYYRDKQPIFDVYRGLSIPDLVELSKQPFSKAQDKFEVHNQQGELITIDPDMEFDCFCKQN